MRKFILLAILTLMSLPAFSEASRLVFTTTDGTTHAIAAMGLEIEFDECNMVASNGEESLTLPLAELATMEFAGQTSGTASVYTPGNRLVAVTGINGMPLGNFASLQEAHNALRPGIYIVKNEQGEVTKLIVRK